MTPLNFNSSPVTKTGHVGYCLGRVMRHEAIFHSSPQHFLAIGNSHLDSDIIMDLSICECCLSVNSLTSAGKGLNCKIYCKKHPYCLVLEGQKA